MRKRTPTKLPALEIPDETLVAQSLEKDERAFELLIQRYGRTLFKFIYRYFGDYDQSCDIMQQVFLQPYLSLPKLDAKRPLKNWLFQVARNRCLDELRRKHPIYLSDLESEEEEEEKSVLALIRDPRPRPGPTSRSSTSRKISCCMPSRACRRISDRVVYLRYTAQLSFSEIGKKLGIPETTAKTHFHRARHLLQASLG